MNRSWRTLDAQPTRIIAHRGASGLRPEHTLEGYRLAISQGADVIEPDLVPSADGVLFARHERVLGRSTDIAQRPGLATRARVDAAGAHEWFAEDLSSAEFDQLRARQPFPGRDPGFDRQFAIPRFTEILALARSHWRQGRVLGVYPEIKHPLELSARGIDSTALLIDCLQQAACIGAASPVWVQCFELAPLARVHQAGGNPVFALFEADAIAGLPWLRALHRQAPWLAGVALPKSAVIGAAGNGDLLAAAHELGWQVHLWTLRDDSVMADMATVQQEYQALFALGADALFCDFPASAVAALAAF
ncbi:MAG: glycerophosphodiester phosphodiesterase [Lysobacterales bacterium CG02_land_8_20_14_3_00_62_12]|nr:MAG: glycerophosphodiester phosphodiesterase [Xanthomonadales bacterium CG02_land_8_20_14_3_00_62_12]